MAVLLGESGDLFLVPDDFVSGYPMVSGPIGDKSVTGEALDAAMLFAPPEEGSDDGQELQAGPMSTFQESFSIIASLFRFG